MQDCILGFVCMECRELRHNRHTVLLLTGHIVVSPNARGATCRLRTQVRGLVTSETGTMLSYMLGVGCESDGLKGFVGI